MKNITGDKLKIKYKGIFDMQGLISLVTDWFESRGYEVLIQKFKHKTKTFGFEDELQIKGWLDETELHRIEFIFRLIIWDRTEVEVIVEGQKKTLMKGRLFIVINGSIEIDPYGRYEGSVFSRALRNFMMNKILFHNMFTIYADRMEYKSLEIMNCIKEFLDMQSKGKYYKNMW